MMRTSDFDYELAPERIAQSPAIPRDSCKLLVLNKDNGSIAHRVFTDIIDYLQPQDLLVVNETKVMPARLIGHRQGGGSAELLLLERLSATDERQELWEALVQPGKRLKPGAKVYFEGLSAEIIDWSAEGGRGQRRVMLSSDEGSSVDEALHTIGSLPLPPYITSYKGDTSWYQTVYAEREGSAAAPTAGLHFTSELLERVRAKGTRIEAVDLCVGLDTFRAVDVEYIKDHTIHSERYSLTQQVIDAIAHTRAQGGRIIAVGTTSVRCLESAWDNALGALRPRNNEATSLYITPGYEFKSVDALITNFHMPRSTLLMLVSALASREIILQAYEQAAAHGYRFLSFGDAMLIT